MKKRLIAMLLCGVLVCASFAGCAKKDDGTGTGTDGGSQTATDTDNTDDNTPTVDYSTKEISLKDNKSSLKIQGRVGESEKGLVIVNTASGIEFNANCKGSVEVKITVPEDSAYGGFYITSIVDGRKQPRIHVEASAGTYDTIVATGLSEGVHSFKILTQTECTYGSMIFRSITIDGVLAERPADAEHYIEFVGDSITCGYGNYNCPAGTPGAMSPLYEDGTATYAYRTVSSLGADYSMYSRSGIGITCGFVPTNMGDYYKSGSLAPADGYGTYTYDREPDVIVVFLGTNDFSNMGTAGKSFDDIQNGMVDMTKMLHEAHPGAKIVWLYGMMIPGVNDTVKAAVEAAGGASAGYYSLQLAQDNGGGDGHPSAAAHLDASERLAEFLKTIL